MRACRSRPTVQGRAQALMLTFGCRYQEEKVPPPAVEVSAQRGSSPAPAAETRRSMGKRP